MRAAIGETSSNDSQQATEAVVKPQERRRVALGYAEDVCRSRNHMRGFFHIIVDTALPFLSSPSESSEPGT